jgi:hypothetical protein
MSSLSIGKAKIWTKPKIEGCIGMGAATNHTGDHWLPRVIPVEPETSTFGEETKNRDALTSNQEPHMVM